MGTTRLIFWGTVFSLLGPGLMAGSALEGNWQGEVQIPPLSFSIAFENVEGELRAALDIPSDGISGLQLTDLRFDGQRLSFVVPIPEAPVSCEAKIQEDGSFSGTYNRAGQTGTFWMKRAD